MHNLTQWQISIIISTSVSLPLRARKINAGSFIEVTERIRPCEPRNRRKYIVYTLFETNKMAALYFETTCTLKPFCVLFLFFLFSSSVVFTTHKLQVYEPFHVYSLSFYCFVPHCVALLGRIGAWHFHKTVLSADRTLGVLCAWAQTKLHTSKRTSDTINGLS